MQNDIYIVEKYDGKVEGERIFPMFKDTPYSMFLDSALAGGKLGRYSIIVFGPFLVFEASYDSYRIIYGAEVEEKKGHPLECLRYLLDRYRSGRPAGDIPFVSGCVGLFSYDAYRMIEQLPDPVYQTPTSISGEYLADHASGGVESPSEAPMSGEARRVHCTVKERTMPDIALGFYNNAIVIDHLDGSTYIAVSSAGMEHHEGLKDELARKLENIKSMLGTCSQAPDETSAVIHGDGSCVSQHIHENRPRVSHENRPRVSVSANAVPVSDHTADSYCEMVEIAREYIRNGDIYQVNLSQRFKTRIFRDPYDIYLQLRLRNPAPFAAYLNMGGIKVLSSSPERFIRIVGNRIETRPIKGTRPRGATAAEDEKMRKELWNSEKDRAELTMIVDLERNDIGRVCRIGTVTVENGMEIEEYATVFHLVATVSGELKAGTDIVDCIKATFPGGSITGAPKIRAMEIIDELEPARRGIYTGSIGYIDFCGDADLNIAIRTIVVNDDEACYNVGGGIVWDSRPEAEYTETLDKGRALNRVLSQGW